MKKRRHSLLSLAAMGLLAGVGSLVDFAMPQPVVAAEEVRLSIGGPFVFSVSVDALEAFAETGEIKEDLRLITRFMGDDILDTLRRVMAEPLPYDVVQVDNILYSNLGRDALENLGKIIESTPGINGFRGLRGAVITAAANAGPDGWTFIDVLRQFPTRSIDINGPELLTLRRSLEVYLSYNDAAVGAIQAQAADTARKQASVPNPESLDQAGTYGFQRRTLTLENQGIRQTDAGIQLVYDFNVEMFLPEGLLQPAPVIIISHGFGDVQSSFDFLAEHLASHGFAVFIPDHVGSSLDVRQNFLRGDLNTILSPTEFVSRPQEVSFVIDELTRLVETSPEWASKLNLDRIGMVGDSLGATTVMASAGAEINSGRIARACDSDSFILNLAQYLLCQARFLPPAVRQLSDPRITAIVASHAMGGGLYGPEGISQIDIPMLLLAGSDDVVAPTAAEQIHPFIWAESEEKYLAVMSEGTHFTAKPGRPGGQGGIISLFVGENREIGTRYFKALNVAFWNVYLRGLNSYRSYLTARYGEQLSAGEPLALDIIRELSPETLETAYGRQTPIAIVPEPITETLAAPARGDSVLAEVAETGVVKVGIRQDAFPFGYVDEGATWQGYCRSFAADLRDELAQTLNLPISVKLVEMVSTLENRFELVKEGTVHVECGPNTIRSNVDGVTFSSPMLVSGMQFLVRRNAGEGKRSLQRQGARIGVLPRTTTERFLAQSFPQARPVPFPGSTGRRDAIAALSEGRLDAVAGDGILLLGEVQRQGLTTANFALEPERPLACQYYGLILPAGDPTWRTFIDDFMDGSNPARLRETVPSSLLDGQLSLVDFCLNQVANQPAVERSGEAVQADENALWELLRSGSTEEE